MVCDAFEVVVVPFPFTDTPEKKRRPALVLSRRQFNASGATVLAMITSARHARWPGDVVLNDPPAVGLKHASVVRLKLFTLDNRLIDQVIGRLPENGRDAVEQVLRRFLV